MGKKIAVLILAIVGLVFIGLSSPEVFRSFKIKSSGVEAEGTVTNIIQAGRKSELAKVTASFNTADGQPVITTAMKRNYVSVGDKVKVWYLSDDPHSITFGDSAGYNLRGVLLGAFIFVFGMYFFSRYVVSDISGKKLRSTGMKIPATVSIERDERFRAGDRNPYIIKGVWTDGSTNKEYIYKSKLYTIDPAPYLGQKSYIDVYIKPGDPSKYYMDVSFMPEGNNTIG